MIRAYNNSKIKFKQSLPGTEGGLLADFPLILVVCFCHRLQSLAAETWASLGEGKQSDVVDSFSKKKVVLGRKGIYLGRVVFWAKGDEGQVRYVEVLNDFLK